MLPTIDLDREDTIDLDREDREPGSRRAARRRRVAPLAAAVSLFVLLTLTGLPTTAPVLSQVWTGPALHGFLWVDARSVYTLEPTLAGVALSARSITSGAVRWRYPLMGSLAQLYAAEPPVLIPVFGPDSPARAATTVSSTTTGLLLGIYPVPAMPLVYFTDSVAVIIDRVPGGEPTGPDPGGPNRIEAARGERRPAFNAWHEMHLVTGVDLDSGVAAWSRTISPGSTWALPDVHPWRDGFVGAATSPGWMAVTSADGTTEVWRLNTGAVRARTNVGDLRQWSYVAALPDELVVNSGGWPDAVVTGYDPDDLSRRWRAPMAGLADLLSWPVPCGELACIVSASEVWGVDLPEGEPVWRRWIADLYAVTDDVLVAATIVDGPVVLDTSTGDMQDLPGDWRVAKSRTRTLPLVAYRPGPDGYLLGLLDIGAAGADVTPLGGAGPDALPQQCGFVDSHIACTVGGDVQVWRVRRSPA